SAAPRAWCTRAGSACRWCCAGPTAWRNAPARPSTTSSISPTGCRRSSPSPARHRRPTSPSTVSTCYRSCRARPPRCRPRASGSGTATRLRSRATPPCGTGSGSSCAPPSPRPWRCRRWISPSTSTSRSTPATAPRSCVTPSPTERCPRRRRPPSCSTSRQIRPRSTIWPPPNRAEYPAWRTRWPPGSRTSRPTAGASTTDVARRHWHLETFVCSIRGHCAPAATVSRLRPDDKDLGFEENGHRYARCLRCDGWVSPDPLPPPTSEVIPPDREIEKPRRGRELRDAVVLRIIAADRALHSLVFGLLAIGLTVLELKLGPLKSWANRLLRQVDTAVANSGQGNSQSWASRQLHKVLGLHAGTLKVLIFTAIAYCVV